MIDTHSHLNFKAFKKDVGEVINRANQKGVKAIIIPGTDISSSKKAVEIIDRFSGCYAAVGIHPHHAQDENLTVGSKLKDNLEKLVKNKKVIAVGEIGLDYFRYIKTRYSDNIITAEIKKKQKELLLLQLELSQSHHLPVIIHCRDAFTDLLEIISSFKHKNKKLTGVFHCFSGTVSDLKKVVSMGFYVGFDGNITYGNKWGKIVAETPPDRLLLETDAPFLTPVPFRTTRNEPSYLPLVARQVALFQGLPLKQTLKTTSANARRLFQIP
ncbi:hypothetical protein A3D05_05285 [Candidatus Gottesmanbacteria bacterium RIFCSPHIGHO2_02_FULL_40_24]|uniref:Hydrolase TatD n=1 Tax=Candidatus Gottesmanbacteria bacterium RIFCSPHIGHO2_01_FULL_40_15 TaxID=1798376 RepID=A0A1F5Z6V7_9BACT|nr:MAG: hypothetical protein A2777_01920 [Candidatus Gottesmanbacteria bacterium RIFCSPHIGHO2_01_FULL_40_15]OGG16445.1 MAG: hypothetical protein A3D05_05285 [Candidatus Gottesmanbacteria bacterium RIFCSPHIGHO2_02_FULL_40_24]OGG25559.1 MAG: hypothetical protein A3E42_04435 [Candidatus Gottesmanbacteria bacterium RIFCSPHIGHO2_12_FULL_40_13]OGG32566.1 MAG: hypothetical protein A3I80_05915 [Candidatus Gottesmanbacteria bacterium RIFCSPLOWO2_02_FULL_40_10]